ncbi:hypothetical protein AGMMS50284_4400 [Clostridia bacterium]|nr:hypothetical protein AGMMS50284_4400 [Clostridia bacterium]
MNEYKFNRTGAERKALVSAISEILNQPISYLGAPTFAYEVGEYHIDKQGTVTGEESLNLMVGLAERGFEPEASKTFHLITPRGTLLCQARYDTREEAEADGYSEYFHHEDRDVYIKTAPDGKTEHSKWFAVVGAPFEKPEPITEDPADPETDLVSIEYPLDGFTPEALDNLAKMVTAKESLLKKALGMDDLPIEMHEDRIAFPWFRLTEDNGEIAAYSQFITALCLTAKEKKRVTAKAQETFENEKFALRVWLIGLGLIGKEYGTARKLLVNSNLSGNSSWRYGVPEKAPAYEIPAEEIAQTEVEDGEVQGDE